MPRVAAIALLAIACSGPSEPRPASEPAPLRITDPCADPAAALPIPVVRARSVLHSHPSGRVIARVFAAARGRLRACYVRGQLRDPEMGGRVTARIRIAPSGCVATAEIRYGFDFEVDACLVRVLRSMRFPRIDGWADVRYPMLFD